MAKLLSPISSNSRRAVSSSPWTQIYRRNRNSHESENPRGLMDVRVSADISKSFRGKFCLPNVIDSPLFRLGCQVPCPGRGCINRTEASVMVVTRHRGVTSGTQNLRGLNPFHGQSSPLNTQALFGPFPFCLRYASLNCTSHV